MRVEQIEILIEVANVKSMQKAAEALNMSIQNVSKTIKDLEQEFQTKLFNRTSHGVFLSSDGEYIVNELTKAYTIIRDVKNLYSKSFILSESKETIDRITILSSPSGKLLSSQILEKLCNKFFLNSATLDVQDALAINEMLKASAQTSIYLNDIIFTDIVEQDLPYLKENCADSSIFFLNKYRIGVIISKDNPLATNSILSIKELLNIPFIDHQSSNNDYSLLHVALENINIKLKPKYFLNSEQSCTFFVKKNMGFGLIPYRNDFLNEIKDEVAVIPLKERILINQVVLFNPSFIQSPCYTRVLHILKRSFKYMTQLC